VSYIDQSLVPGEVLIHRARVSWWSQFGMVLLGIVTLVVVIGLVFLAIAWIRIRSTEVAITNRRIIAKFGFITRHTVEINLDKVESLRVEQGFWGRILNFGTVFISGAGSAVAPIPDIADPLVFRRKFTEASTKPAPAR
jgi:uncharacterized membrane protein YdbT with pleckstrin-like domain